MTRHVARRLPQLPGPAAWNTLLGPRPAFAPLEADRTADLIIVGGGFAGLSAARRALQLEPDAKVVLLEAGTIADGSAGRNSGFMIDLPHDLTSEDYAGAGDDRAQISMNRQAIGFARDAVRDYAIDPAFFDPVGKVNGAVSEQAQAHNRSYARHLQSLDEACEQLDAQDMSDLTGSRHYQSGLYTPGTVMLQPAGYIRGLAGGLTRDQGPRIDLHENCPVTALVRTGPDWTAETPTGRVVAPRVILATNGHLESFGFERGRLMQLFLYASMTEELPADAIMGSPRWGITPSDPMGTTLRRIDTAQGGNRIVTRTCASLRSGMNVSTADVDRAARVHRAKFDNRFPMLASAKMEHVWAGHLCLSLNGVSVMRELEPGLISACVQNGLGTARGTLTGIAAAELAFGHSSPITTHFTQEARPTKLLPQPIRDLGANTVIRWKEWRARDE